MSNPTHICQKCGNPIFLDGVSKRWAHLSLKEKDLYSIHQAEPLLKSGPEAPSTQTVTGIPQINVNPRYGFVEPWDPQDKLRSKAERQEGESDNACVSRWISELSHAHPEWEHDQVVAVAHSKCGLSKT